jgi:hypothetical protein
LELLFLRAPFFEGLHQPGTDILRKGLGLHALIYLDRPLGCIEDNKTIRALGDVSLKALAKLAVY